MKKNVIVAQSGGPTAVINATLAGILNIARKSNKVDKVLGGEHGIEGILKENFFDLFAKFDTPEKINLLKHTPAAFLGSCRYKLPNDDEVFAKIFDIFKKNNVGYFIYIGGNDSMDTVDKLSKYAKKIKSDVCIIGCPKTIDNDLAITDHTPGFGSAAKYVATSMREIILDSCVYDKPTLTIVEVMGRNAGWLTAATALARWNKKDAPHLIYLPELPFDVDKFLVDVKNAIDKHRNAVVAISEGIKTADGKYLCEFEKEVKVDAFGHKQMSGAAASLADIVSQRMDVKIRTIEFSLLQRAAAHIASKTDVRESRELGEAGMKAGLDGQTGVMVYIKRVSNSPYEAKIEVTDVSKVANAEVKVPRDWINKEGNDVNKKMIEYLLPLIQGESVPVYENGLPVYQKRIGLIEK